MTSTEIELRESFAPASAEASAIWAEEMQGASVEFPTITTPRGGGTTWEVEGEDPVRRLEGVVVDDYEAHALFLEKYDPANPKAPDAYWIAGECQYVTDEARAAGFDESSINRRDGVSNRLVLFLARPGELVPLKIDLSGASVRPWVKFKQAQLTNKSHRVTDAVVALELESKQYKSGFSGSLIVPSVVGFLPEDIAAIYYEQRHQLKPYTRVRTAGMSLEEHVVEAEMADGPAAFQAAFGEQEIADPNEIV